MFFNSRGRIIGRYILYKSCFGEELFFHGLIDESEIVGENTLGGRFDSADSGGGGLMGLVVTHISLCYLVRRRRANVAAARASYTAAAPSAIATTAGREARIEVNTRVGPSADSIEFESKGLWDIRPAAEAAAADRVD